MIDKCPKCNKKIKGIGNTMTGDGEMSYPIWDCDCKCNPANYAEKKMKKPKERIITYENSRIDRYFLQNDFKILSDDLILFTKNFDWLLNGKSLFVFGNPGTKKTGQITALCKIVYKKGYSVLYYRTTEIPYQRNMEEIKNVKLLVLDNFAKDSFENSRGAIFDLIDFRIHNYLSTIVITNIEKDNIAEIYGMALQDRINLFKKIKIFGESNRKEL